MSWAVGNLRMRSIRLKFGYALPSASSCYLGIARKRSLLSERYSVPPCTSAIQTSLMALGCCVGSLVLSVHRKNSTSRGNDRIARRRLKKRFNYFGDKPK